MTSTCSISRLLMRAWAPVSFMISSSDDSGHEKPLAAARGEVALGARRRAGALRNYYENVEGGHRSQLNTTLRGWSKDPSPLRRGRSAPRHRRPGGAQPPVTWLVVSAASGTK